MSDDVQDLERNIQVERTMLDRTLSQLSDALSPERISSTVAREVQARGGALGHTVVDAARANPAGAMLVGAGLVALLAGPKRPAPEPAYDTRHKPVSRGMSRSDPLTEEFDRRVDAATSAQDDAPRAPRMRAALNKGLAHLPAPARQRVIRVREAAIDAQERLDRQAAIAKRKAQSFHHRQPFSTAALAVGAGALLAAFLPRTRTEDALLGSKRDALMQQAELTLRDEIAAATATGEAALRSGIEAGYEQIRPH
ncbi:DUF3618 domain-containing protein [Roseobacter denitrificans]|uniref:DUF3618 domain-containing protein n=1 Tax=Roseobacter denitrificans (strain ATCC 33942 / OCh 114) TaxID=375451 RepID=Q166P8_ROSDO|nr:DUF3618 domain-containing protein [Roseobacter denitrificans]ABG32045.1 hypothetical protein RD1_2481 [Roseobacter denitrificans OCh 114]AVL54710.1 DUF3618 domain-containing protein [Roseobacter denitrificans]SFG36791.1 Protein of unknown function [Roseobacter denitrificans OCh 114]